MMRAIEKRILIGLWITPDVATKLIETDSSETLVG